MDEFDERLRAVLAGICLPARRRQRVRRALRGTVRAVRLDFRAAAHENASREKEEGGMTNDEIPNDEMPNAQCPMTSDQ